jgi:hypothetical protein
MTKANSRAGSPAEPCTEDTALETRAADVGQQVITTQGCDACQSTAETGSWVNSIPQGFTHCRVCHVTFPGSNRWGHCSRCHQTFSGGVAFDLHQRVDKDGDIGSDCLCRLLTPGPGEAAMYGAPLQCKWAVSGSRTLVSEFLEWGAFWTLASDLSEVFE